MKAKLEFYMPESCFECDASYPKDWLISYQVWCSLRRRCVHEYDDKRSPFCPLKIVSDDAPTVNAVTADKLQVAINAAERTRDSIIGGSQFTPYMYAYLRLKDSIEELIDAKMLADSECGSE